MMSMIIGVLSALMAAFGWALSSVLLKIGMRNKKVVSVNIIRLYVGSLIYAIVFLFTRGFKEIASLSSKQLLIAFVSAQFGFVIGDYFYLNALKITGVSRTVPVTSSYPLWTILWAFLFLGRSINVQIIVGAFLVFFAILLVRQTGEEEKIDPKGLIFATLAPISWSLAITMLDYLSSQMSAMILSGIRVMMGSIGVTFFLPKYLDDIKTFNLKEFRVVGLDAIIELFISGYAFVISVEILGSEIVTPITAVNPIIASYLAIAFLKENPNRKIILSLILAVVGIIFISLA